MKRPCEVCSGLEKIGLPKHEGHKTRRVLVGSRIVVLCDAHAKELEDVAVESIEGLTEHFREPGGRRSLVGRRAPLDRRVFPPRPEGRRKSEGRRHDDALE